MIHIFFVHSNIAAICAYDSIKRLLKEKERVMVLLVRNTKWQFDFPGVKVVDISRLTTLYYTKLPRIRSFRDIMLARIIKNRIGKIIHNLVENEEFLMYIPQYHVGIVSFLCEDKLCKGYYYTEEGTLSYLSIDKIKSVMNYSKIYRCFSVVTGAPYHFAYHINSKFKGVIALSLDAFPWYNGMKTINQFPTHFTGNIDYSKRRSILILPPLTFDVDELISMTKDTVVYLSETSTLPIAIKFHPRSGKEEKDNLSVVMNIVNELGIEVLPQSYIVEFNVLEGNSEVYSMQVKTSLLIYSVLAGKKAVFVHLDNNKVVFDKFEDIQAVLS